MKSAKAILGSLLAGLTACGGGGGDSVAEFDGVWTGNISLVEDSCGVVETFETYAFFNHLVNQAGNRIVLDNGFLTFAGEVESDASFKVSHQRAYPALYEGATCLETITWRYEKVRDKFTDFVVRSSDIICTGGGSSRNCQVAFSGSAYRPNEDHGGGPILFASEPAMPIDLGAGDGSSGTAVPESSL